MTTATEEIIVSVTPRNRANFRRLKTNSIQSYKRWEKENELLYAMMEDESEWLAKLFPDVVITPDFFFYALEDGSLLCRLANYIQEKAESYSQRHHIPVPGKKFRYHTMGKCSKEIKLFRSRENVQQFLTWCRSHGIPEAILFESNDVVQVDDYREGCRGIIICLMEIVRRTAKFELDELPKLIQMEKEIEEDEAQSHTDLSNGQGQILDVEEINMTEIDNLEVRTTDPPEIQSPSSMDSDSGVDSVFDQEEGDNAASRLKEFWHEETEIKEETEITSTTTTVTRKQNLLKSKDQKSSPKKASKELPSLLESSAPKSELDKQVCKIAQDYNIKVVHRLKEGKYIILGRIMFVRMLNEHMLVRIGGGWDTLEHYLMTHAPSKQALETPSTPSPQPATSPRNSISASGGVRTSLFEKFKRKEQVGVVNRDSSVYSSQGSLHQQLGNQSSPKIKDRGKRSSLTNKDEKDITEAIRKISTSVSKTLADRPASFTSRTFNLLKSRFDKGIFGASRRTSSPDLSLKGSKIVRRSSDTTIMADVATNLAFDGEQIPVVNNNVSEEKQPDSESTEEISVGKIAVPIENAPGDEESTASDQTDGSVPVGDLIYSEQSRLVELSSSQANGNANIADVSLFDPFAAVPDQDKPVPIDNTSSEINNEQPSNSEHFGNGEMAHNQQPAEAVTETTVESSLPQNLDSSLEMAQTKPDFDSSPEASPRPIDIGDLLHDSQVSAEVDSSAMPSPLINVEQTPAPEEPVHKIEGADIQPVNSDKPVVNEDMTPSIEEAPPAELDPSIENESQPPELASVNVEEPTSEEILDPSQPPQPSQLVEESGKSDEINSSEEPVVEQPEPPKPEEKTTEVDEPLTDVAVVKSEGESTEVAPVVGETNTQQQRQAQEAAAVEVIETASVLAAEVKVEEEKTAEVDEPLAEVAVVKSEGESTEVAPAVDETNTEEPRQAQEAAAIEVIETAPVIAAEVKVEEEKTAEVDEPLTEVAVIKSEGESTEVAPAVDETNTQEPRQAQEAAAVEAVETAPVIVAEVKVEGKPAEDQPPKADSRKEKATKAKPAAAGAKEKSPSKPSSAAKRPMGAARLTSPTKGSTSATATKDAKAPTTKAPPSKPASAKAPAVKAPAGKAPTTKASATKTPASAIAGAKKPASKPAETKADGAKKTERPKSSVAARPSTQPAARATSAADKRVPAPATKTAASKNTGKDVKDAGPPKSAPKTTTSKPASSAKSTPKTTAPAKKPLPAKPTPTSSAKPADSKDGAAPPKKPSTRPTSAKPKPTASTTTTTTTVKKTTTTTTTITKSGTTAPAKTQATTTKTVTQTKTGQPRTTTTTSSTTKTSAKAQARPASAAKKPTDTKPAANGTKSKTGGKPNAGSIGAKPTPKSAPKKNVGESVKENELKQEEKQPVSQPVPEAPTEAETKTEEKPTETLENVLEERPVGEVASEDKSIEPTSDSSPGEKASESIDLPSEEFIGQASVVTRIITTETTTVNEDGEEQTTTSTDVSEDTLEAS